MFDRHRHDSLSIAMNVRSLRALVFAAAVCSLPAVAATQEPQLQQAPATFGSPAPGVTVPGRYSNPQQSQELLNPQQGTPTMDAPAQGGPDNRLDMSNIRSVEGEEGSTFMMDSIVGVSSAGDPSGETELIIEGSDIYTGVTPDHRDTVPHISPYQRAGAEQARANQLTWLGFQPLDDRTRVFVQTGRPAQYQVTESPDGLTLTLRLRYTRIGLSNFMRFVDASHFDRPVNMVRTARTADGVTVVTIELNRPASYEVVPDGNYLYIDLTE